MSKDCPKIKTDLLLDMMPHRPPMRWITAVQPIHDTLGYAYITLDKLAPYFENDRFLPSSFAEMIAQGYGFLKVCELKLNQVKNVHLKKAFVAAIDDFVWEEAILSQNDELKIELKTMRQLETLFLIKGVVYFKDRQLASANIKLYTPPEEIAGIKL